MAQADNTPFLPPKRDWQTSDGPNRHGARRFIYPTPAQSDQVLEDAYQKYLRQELSDTEYTQQKDICFKAKNNDGSGLLGDPMEMMKKLPGIGGLLGGK